MREFIIAHLSISVLSLFIMLKERDMRIVYKFFIIFFLPIGGAMLLLLLLIMKKVTKKVNTGLVLDMVEEVTLSGLGGIRMVDVKNEVNIVPIEDALTVNSDAVKRKMILDISKDDAISYMSFLEKALNNEDSETSHYAATAVLDIQRTIMLSIQDFSVKYENDKNDMDILLPYSEVLKSYLSSTILDEKSQIRYRNIYSQVLGNIIKQKPEKIFYLEKINCDIELNDYEKAKEYCSEFLEKHPGIEEPYLCFLKYYFIMNDVSGFKNIMTALKKSDVKFSSKALETVRYWGNAL